MPDNHSLVTPLFRVFDDMSREIKDYDNVHADFEHRGYYGRVILSKKPFKTGKKDAAEKN